MSFIGVYKALFDYVPQAEQELAISENDILYLLEKSQVDDWWTVKKRVLGPDAEEPVGLVPSNYIEPANIIGTAVAVYDYDRQTDEELSFKEGDQFQVFDDKDPDWILVTKNNQEFGFAPSNYIQISHGLSGAGSGAASSALPAPVSISSFPPPPQRHDREPSAATSQPVRESEREQLPLPTRTSPVDDDDEEEAPPPLPSIPRPDTSNSRRSSGYNKYDNHDDYDDDDDYNHREDSGQYSHEPEDLLSWDLSEVRKKKKHKATLAVGNGRIYFTPEGESPMKWKVKDLINYSNESKHVFLTFAHPDLSLELYTSSKDLALTIIEVLGELRGAVNQSGLKEVKEASRPSRSRSLSSGNRTAKIMFDFDAQGDDELDVRTGDAVYVLDDKKSQDWWLVQNIKTGDSGVVPAQFVQKDSSLTQFTNKFKFSRTKSKDNVNSSPSKSSSSRKRSASSSDKNDRKGNLPKESRVRTWEDQTGNFKVDAEFLGVVEGKIHLHKVNGVKIAVAAQKLSNSDLEYVEKVTGMSLDKYKVDSRKKSRSGTSEDGERRERRERERKRRERDEKERDREDRQRERERERRARDLERENERLRQDLREKSDTPPPQPTRPISAATERSVTTSKKEDYDWFEFFLEAGVDVNQCQRYSNNFNNEQIDPEILPSIDSSVLRTLGLREGDIIRVTKYLDQKYNRQPAILEQTNGGLFTGADGELKANRTGAGAAGTAVTGALPSPDKTAPVSSSTADDDAWTVKPAAGVERAASAPLDQQHFSGSVQDLVNLKPLAPTATASSTRSTTYAPVPSAKPLQPLRADPSSTNGLDAQKTGASIAPQATGAVPLDPFKTGGGNLLPLATGGTFFYLPTQQTGLIAMNPTGLMPLQKTGGLLPLPLQKTGGLQPIGLQQTSFASGVPLQKTGGLPSTFTGGLPPALTGGLPPALTGGLPPALTGGLPPALTGGLPPALTGGLPPALTGGLPPALTGGFNKLSLQGTSGAPFPNSLSQFGASTTSLPPTTTFGQSSLPAQTTGFQSIVPLQPTGFNNPLKSQITGFNATLQPQVTGFNGFQSQPQSQPQVNFNSFQSQATGFSNFQPTGIQPSTTFSQSQSSGMNNRAAGQPTGFNQSISSPPSFNSFGQQVGQVTNSFQNATLNANPFPQQQQQQQPFNNQQFGTQPFGNQPLGSQQYGNQPFGNQSFGSQLYGNQIGNGIQQQLQQPSFNGFQQQQQPQSAFGGFAQPPLEAQPTGFGFGNSGTAAGASFGGASQRANLANATPDNPFGF